MVPRTYTHYSSALFQSCKELMNQTVSMSCGHSAFKTCQQEMIFKQSTGSKPCTCPYCRARIEGDRLKVNFIASVLIGRIQVRCMVSAAPGLGGIAKKKNVLALSPLSFWTASMDLMPTWRNQRMDQQLESWHYEKGACIHCLKGVETFTLDSRVKYCPEDPRPAHFSVEHSYQGQFVR